MSDDCISLSTRIGLTQIAPKVDLTGRTAVITGAADGIGRAVAKAYHMYGAHVVALDVQKDKLESLKAELGSRVTTIPFDMRTTDDAMLEKATALIMSPTGRLDIYLMNAGVIKMNDLSKGFFDASMDEHDALHNINFRTHKALFQKLKPYLEWSDAPRVILTSSPIVGRADPKTGDYAWTKGALENAVATARMDLRADNSAILVTGYVPPPVQNLLRATIKNEPVYANPGPDDVIEVALRQASPALDPRFDGKMLTYVDDRTKNVTGHDKDGKSYTYDWNKRSATGGFILHIAQRDMGKGGGTEGEVIVRDYDTMIARRLAGAGPVPPLDEKVRLKDWSANYGVPDYLKQTLSFGGRKG